MPIFESLRARELWVGDVPGGKYYSYVIMGAMASLITSLAIVYSTVYWGADQRKHQSSASLVFVQGIHRWPVKFPHKGPVTRKMFSFDYVIMYSGRKSPSGRSLSGRCQSGRCHRSHILKIFADPVRCQFNSVSVQTCVYEFHQELWNAYADLHILPCAVLKKNIYIYTRHDIYGYLRNNLK